jgi:hypothetical protein
MECKILLLINYLQEVLKVDRFRWAACQLDALENCLDYRTLQRAVVSLPKTLDETYARVLRGIPEEYKQNAITSAALAAEFGLGTAHTH